ncbi:MAG: L,D-transpeptidase [Patescibacteria group bacterium]|nr:L,D-transpeptidase [Patescibacteria group bacterium]
MGKKFLGFLMIAGLIVGGVFYFKPEDKLQENKSDFKLQVENGVKGVFHGQEIMPPIIDLTKVEPETQVLGETDPVAKKRILINLSTQTLSAYQGDDLFMEALISTGKWGRTPTGEFTIWSKFKATRMSGGSGADYYNLPNVPYTMFFSGSGVAASRGFALHGAYWHNNFGHTMSHGCVNMRTIDAQKLFNWADVNEKITIYDEESK